MSVVYFLACNKKLPQTEFLYSDISNCQNVFTEDDGILFQSKLTDEEQDIANNLFQQKIVYAVRATLPFNYELKHIELLGKEVYNTERNQTIWLINFIKKIIKTDKEVFFLRTALGHPINYNKILSQHVKIDNFILQRDNFDFKPQLIYQFVGS